MLNGHRCVTLLATGLVVVGTMSLSPWGSLKDNTSLCLKYGYVEQVALFSATMPPDVLDVAKSWLKKPKTFRVALSSACISRTVVQVSTFSAQILAFSV